MAQLKDVLAHGLVAQSWQALGLFNKCGYRHKNMKNLGKAKLKENALKPFKSNNNYTINFTISMKMKRKLSLHLEYVYLFFRE